MILSINIEEAFDSKGNIKFFISTFNLDPEVAGEIGFSFKVKANLGQSGDIILKSNTRSFRDGLDTYIGTVVPPTIIKMQPVYLKSGTKDQKGGKVTIKETSYSGLTNGEDIILTVGNGMDGLQLKVQLLH